MTYNIRLFIIIYSLVGKLLQPNQIHVMFLQSAAPDVSMIHASSTVGYV